MEGFASGTVACRPLRERREGRGKLEDNLYIHMDPMFHAILEHPLPIQPQTDSQTDGLHGVNCWREQGILWPWMGLV